MINSWDKAKPQHQEFRAVLYCSHLNVVEWLLLNVLYITLQMRFSLFLSSNLDTLTVKLKARWRSCEISFLNKQALHLKTIKKENPRMCNLYSNVHVFCYLFQEDSEVRRDTDIILKWSNNFLLYAIKSLGDIFKPCSLLNSLILYSTSLYWHWEMHSVMCFDDLTLFCLY